MIKYNLNQVWAKWKRKKQKKIKEARKTHYTILQYHTYNITLYKIRNEAIIFYEDYSLIASEEKTKQRRKQVVKNLKY